MKLILYLVLVEQLLVSIVPSISEPVNNTLLIASVRSSLCSKGEQRYDFVKRRCVRCPQKCRRASGYSSYIIPEDPVYGALECYPCICKKGKKFYDKQSKQCVRCPLCNANSIITNSNVTVDKWFGALNCYTCDCKNGFYANRLTHHQCVDCRNCQQEHKEVQVSCSHDNNAICGDCIDGYTSTEYGRCLKTKSEMESTTQTSEPRKYVNGTGVSRTTANPIKPASSQDSTIHKSHLIIIVILIMVVLIFGVAVFFGGRTIRNNWCRNVTDESILYSQSTVASITKPTDVFSEFDQTVNNPLISKRDEDHRYEQNHKEQHFHTEYLQKDDPSSKCLTECIQINADNVILQVGDHNTVCQRLLSNESS